MLFDVLVLNQFHIVNIIPTWGQLRTLLNILLDFKIFFKIMKLVQYSSPIIFLAGFDVSYVLAKNHGPSIFLSRAGILCSSNKL